MRYLGIIAILIFGFPFTAFPTEVNTVLIVSIDALHPDALHRESTPNIHRLMEEGVFTLDGHSTDPPLTLLSHAAMLSGIGPEEGGRKDNSWHSGLPVIAGKTIFNDAKDQGYGTGFFYSKEKLGYLVNDAVDRSVKDRDFSIENAADFITKSNGKQFCFLHISGLDRAGPVEGWMSPGYMEELYFIDQAIAPLIRMVIDKKKYLIVITSDHAGHGTIHGSDHPDDSKLPLIMVSENKALNHYQGVPFHVCKLRGILDTILYSQ
jgi:predicted AlkP superfamily pyrophosphatase or phosphodiesterase